jgi:hypothetical protein
MILSFFPNTGELSTPGRLARGPKEQFFTSLFIPGHLQ